MKTLIIVAHPDIEQSAINKVWVEKLKEHPQKYHIHQLHQVYPTGKIDVEAEQRLVEAYDHIVFQFPFYWFSSPPILKQWMDEVLTHGWAYGSRSGYKLANKKIALAITAGIDEEEYRPGARYSYTMEQLTAPFELTFKYVKADYRSPFVYYGIELNSSREWIAQSIPRYLAFLEQLTNG